MLALSALPLQRKLTHRKRDFPDRTRDDEDRTPNLNLIIFLTLVEVLAIKSFSQD
jgi:hypothetical protein